MRACSVCHVVALVAALAACGKGDKPPPPQAIGGLTQESGPRRPSHGEVGAPRVTDPPPQGGGEPSEGQRIFRDQCARCHGLGGRGDGEVAATINPRPRDYTDPKWQASVSDDDLRKIIIEGGQAVGKSVMMPPNPTLKDKPHVVDELIAIIRQFGKR